MRYIVFLLILTAVMQLSAQPGQEVIDRLINTYDFGQPSDQPPVSEMIDDSKTSLTPGSFLAKDRPEFLIEVWLVRGSFEKAFAFTAYLDASGEWQRSTWFVYGYTTLEPVDLESDGLHELVHTIEMPGARKDQDRYRLVSLAGDEEAELYKVDGFRTNAEFYVQASAGDHMSSRFNVELEDVNGDGKLDIVETITDEYFNFQYDNINGNRVFDEGHEMRGAGDQSKTTVYKLKKGKLEVLEVR